MARHTFGGGASDFLAVVGPGGVVRAAAGSIAMWTAETGGTQVTDLLLNGSPVTAIPVGADGQVPTFSGPDGVTVLWAAAGAARVALRADVPPTDAGVADMVDSTTSVTRSALNGLYVRSSRTAAHIPSLGLFFPEAEGAVGDGVADDSAAWAATISALVAAGGRGAIHLDGTKTYLLADVGFATNGIVDARVEGNGATVKAKPTPTNSTIRVGATSTVGRLRFIDLTFDDNAAGRPVENLVLISLEKFDAVQFSRCRFTNLTYHFISSHVAVSGDARVIIDSDCTFDGAGTSATASHLYMSSLAHWDIGAPTFSNAGNTGAGGAIQALYVGGCASLRMDGPRFVNCGQAWDLRSAAAQVRISNAVIIGGPNGAGNTSGAGNFTVATDDAVMEDVTIIDSHHPVVLRVTSGNRSVFKNWTYRKGVNAPAGQRFARIAGAGHKFIDPDLVCQTTSNSTASVFDLHDQPTDIDIVGGVIEGGVRLFRYATAQTTVAGRIRGTLRRNLTNVWVNTEGAGGDSTVAALEVTPSDRLYSASLDFPSVAANGNASLGIAVTGATVGGPVVLGPPSTLPLGLVPRAVITSATEVTVTLHNVTGAAIDPSAGTWTVALPTVTS